MKSQLSIFAVLTLLIVFLSNFSADKTETFIMTVVNEEPRLPSTPYEYEVTNIPKHLIEVADSIDIGYEGGGIDTLSFISITNDFATLGRVLFYDKKLSAMEDISCASCHDQSLSFTENKDFSEGLNALTQRNSMHLNDLAWTNNSHFSWDMEQTSLHEMITLPLSDENEIGANMLEISQKLEATEYYPELFAAAYGNAVINEGRIVNALAQFIKSMTTFNSKLDHGAANDFEDFTEEELRGKELFSFSCSTCHVQGNELIGLFGFPIHFEGSALEFFPSLFNNGLPVDEDDAGAGDWDIGFENLFKITTLRNIELTAPYMHDGRFSTLEEVVDHYSDDVEINECSSFIPNGGFNFDDQEKSDLVAFLKTLTDKTFITDEKFSDPFAPGLNTNNFTEFEELVLKPNPMSERAVIEYKNDAGKLVSINILSADGKLLKHDSTKENAYYMEKEFFEKGIYFIQLTMENSRSIQKLIVK